jgi:uncharacterized protein (TIGR02145 family)
MKQQTILLALFALLFSLAACDSEQNSTEVYSEADIAKCLPFLPATERDFMNYAQILTSNGEFSNERMQEARSCKTKKFNKKFKFTDNRDGREYDAVKIGSQTWMAQNLNFVADSSWCYENDPAECQKYGRLYNWNAAMTACPDGWHLPNALEWDILENYVTPQGRFSTLILDQKGMDNFNFSALPNGRRTLEGFFWPDGSGQWWSSSGSNDVNYASYQSINYNTKNLQSSLTTKRDGFCVRCVKD